MSTRTIIEINHDYLGSRSVEQTEKLIVSLLYFLRCGGWIEACKDYEPAIRVLGQRHHSEPEWKQERR